MSTLALLRVLFKPRLLVPGVRVESIRQLDFGALKRAGYRGAVFDKDNCLTIPHNDHLVPQLREAWEECRKTFGTGNVVIVSNESGTSKDPGGVEAESVSHHLGVPVLLHDVKKPGCSSTVLSYFNSLAKLPPTVLAQPVADDAGGALQSQTTPSPTYHPIKPSELIIVGDRLLTDVVFANTLGALPIWTTKLWKSRDEALLLRPLEKGALRMLDRLGSPDATLQTRFIREEPSSLSVVADAGKLGKIERSWIATRVSLVFLRDRIRAAYHVASTTPSNLPELARGPTGDNPEKWTTRILEVASRGVFFVGRFGWALATDIGQHGWRSLVSVRNVERLKKALFAAQRGASSVFVRLFQRG